jgi:hypothetical protein
VSAAVTVSRAPGIRASITPMRNTILPIDMYFFILNIPFIGILLWPQINMNHPVNGLASDGSGHGLQK